MKENYQRIAFSDGAVMTVESGVQVGLCTISFSELPVDDALALAAGADARGVELWGRAHLPADASAAETARVRRVTERHGLEIAVYGSYARAGEAAWTAERFAGLLDRAVDLGAPQVRVWAGTTGSAQAAPEDWSAVADVLRAWGDLAAARGLLLVVERHCNTLTDFGDCARRLIDAVGHPAVWLNYQVPYPQPLAYYRDELLPDLRLHLPVSRGIHVQNYREQDEQLVRTRVADGAADYAAWPPLLAAAGFSGWAMLEFLPELLDVPPGQLAREEVASLRGVLGAG